MQETFWAVKGCPLRIALVCDLHERPFGEVVRSLRRQRPELICIAGDFVYGAHSGELLKLEKAEYVLPFFSACAELAPSFVSLGNHEWLLTPGDLRLVAQTGVRLLDNAWELFPTNRARLVIGGLSSSHVTLFRRMCQTDPRDRLVINVEAAARSQRVPPETDWLRAYCAEPGYHILLSHHPEYYPRYLKALPIELILSGHAHGGQIRIGGQGLYSPGQGVFPRLTSGVHDGRLVVSRGLANAVPVPRLFNPPELVYVLPEETE